MLTHFSLFAQKQYGFEWIKSYQNYYKFKIIAEGIYSIDSTLLSQSGINLTGIDPKRFQVFRNGIEVAVFIHGQSDGVLNANDKIEFYAKQNDGTLDKQLYQQPQYQPHPWFSMVTDTAAYFLTILPDTTVVKSKRFQWSSDTTFSQYTAQPYFIHEVKIYPTTKFFEGPDLANYDQKYVSSEYLDGVGWADVELSAGQSNSYNLNTPFQSALSFAPLPTLSMKIIPINNAKGTSGNNHHVSISIGPDNASFSKIKDWTFQAYDVQRIDTTFLKTQIGNTQTTFKIDVINDLGALADADALSYIKLNYARQYNLGNETKILFTNAQLTSQKSFINFKNYGNGSFTTPIFFDFTSNQRIKGVYRSGNALALDTNTGVPSQIFLIDSTQIIPINNLSAVQFKVIDPTIGYEFLMITHPSLDNTAKQYRDYRKIKFNTLMVYSQELYDYYTYGDMHPLSVRRLADHLLAQATVKPKFLFLAGRGYQTNYLREAPFYYQNNLVPSIGVRSSDVMFTNGLIGTGFEADIPTGRIPSATDLELNNYFKKVQFYETNSDSILEWRKRILHLSGGDDVSSQTTFSNYINACKNVIVGKSYGATVTSFNKSNSSPVDAGLKNDLIAIQDSGISLLTFLGHGSLTILDVDFGSIDEINNPNKYPLYYLNGCNIGNANDKDPSTDGRVYGKYFICASNKGAIGWLANTNLSIDGNLGAQMNRFYNQFGITNYGKPIGVVIQQASKDLTGGDIITKMHNLQWLLQGDPSVVIYSPKLPDYSITPSNIFVTPQNASALSDSIAVAAIITNLARATDDSLEVTLTCTFPDGSKADYKTYPKKPIYHKDTVYIWLRPKTYGNYVFEINLDKLNKITEGNENNNIADINFFLPGTGLTNLFPLNYSIVNSDTVLFVTQNSDLFAQNVQYVFELDTTLAFNSSYYKTSGTITGGALATWQIVLPQTDTMVYFWRSSFKNPPVGVNPNEGSFTYINNGENGWTQSKFDQYKHVSDYGLLKFNGQSNQIEFSDNAVVVTTKNRRWNHGNMGNFNPYNMNPSTDDCVPSGGLIVNIFHNKSLLPIQCPKYPFNCQYVIDNNYKDVWYYAFNTNLQSGRDEFRRFIDSLDEGTYVALFNHYDAGMQNWDNITRQYLGKLGSIKVAAVQSYYTTYGLIGRKGWTPGQAIEDTLYNDQFSAPTTADTVITVNISYEIKGKWYTGFMESEKIGPTQHWGKLFYYYNTLENTQHDYNYVDVIGVKNDGTDSLIFANANNAKDLSSINAARFPNIKLRVTFADTIERTPNQFGRWMVTYQGVAEGTMSSQVAYDFYKDQLSQGDSVKVTIGFQNLTKIPFDSLPVELKVTDENRTIKYKQTYMYSPLAANASSIINQKIPTANMNGDNTLQLIVNGNLRTQEITLSNNVFNKKFNVIGDKVNPIMDVTFDGYRIMNGDYVSPTPLIKVTSKDDNKYFIQNDTSTFSLSIKRPSTNTYELVNMNSNNVHFIPGTSQNNKAILEYTPNHLPDGIYSLQVNSKDKSGNLSGNNSYTIDFNVVGASSISNFFPYPNPCTTSMRFVFTLTGSKAPDDLLIRILTVSGKVVKEVTKEEFGPIKIGNNISEWAWDGNDNYGDRLANGVYLYQVLTRMDGQSIEKFKTKADKFLIQNTGKIYLMK